MKLISIPALLLMAVLFAGCKPADTASTAPDNASPTSAKTTSGSAMNSTKSSPPPTVVKTGTPTSPGGDQTPAETAPAGGTAKPASPPQQNASGGKSYSIVGTWVLQGAGAAQAVTVFDGNGTCTISGSSPGPDGKTITADAIATYKVTGDKIMVHPVSMKMVASPDSNAKTKQTIDQLNKQMSSKKSPDETSTIMWQDKDTFSLSQKGADGKDRITTFKRKA